MTEHADMRAFGFERHLKSKHEPETFLFVSPVCGRFSVRVGREEVPKLLKDLRQDRDAVRDFGEGRLVLKDFSASETTRLFFGEEYELSRVGTLLNDMDRMIAAMEEIAERDKKP